MTRRIALIPAAGSGSRMAADRPKQYLEIDGKPLLRFGLEAFCRHPRIDRVAVVIAAEDAWFARYDWNDLGPKLEVLPAGGDTRGESVLGGLRALADQVDGQDWILVHDAARPGLDAVLIDRLLEAVGEDPVGGLLALPVADTVKRQDSVGRVDRTLPRDGLWQAQTPQMFRYELLRQALETADPARVTDEASALELYGLAPKLVRGDLRNWKVTYPDDLDWAARWLGGTR